MSALWVVLPLLLAVAAFCARGVLGRRLRQYRWRAAHRDLATANGLSPREARLMWRIGVGAGLDNPAMVFVRPTLFESRALMLGADADLVASIRGKVYGA